ncbi:hypothetical protein COCSUDRAFT_83608, partial [Coccomyxa subellipsoidea C-169]
MPTTPKTLVRHSIPFLLLLFCATRSETRSYLRLHANGSETHSLKEKGDDLFALYRGTILANDSKRKKIAYTCGSGDLCGGVGDRLKGFASTFVLALLLDAEFVVEWTSPVPIDSFFKMPVMTNGEGLRKSAKNATTWSLIDAHSSSMELKKLRMSNFRELWRSNDFISIHLNGAVWNHFVMNEHLVDIGDKYSLNRFSKRQLFEVVMKYYFSTPMPALQNFVVREAAKFR